MQLNTIFFVFKIEHIKLIEVYWSQSLKVEENIAAHWEK